MPAFCAPPLPLSLLGSRPRLSHCRRNPCKANPLANAALAQPSALSHKRVALTAPAPYAARLAPYLLSRSAHPLWLPTISTTSLTSPSAILQLQTALISLPTFRVLAFTSRTAMTELFSHLVSLNDNSEARAADLLRTAPVLIAALGADASAARDTLGVTADIVPLTPSPEGLAAFMGADPDLAGAAVLCPVPLVDGMQEPPVVPEFLSDLRTRGFEVTAVPAYETRPVGREKVEWEIGAVLGGKVDALAFSSAGEAYALAGILTEAEREALVRSVEEGDLFVAAHGPYTARGVRDALGVGDVRVSEDFSSFEGMVSLLERAFETRDREEGKLLLPT